MDNPFIYGKVARGEYFADRESEIQELLSDIAASQSVIIFSPRRYGKTSLIFEVLDRARQKGFLGLYLDLFRVTSKEAFVSAYAREIARLYQGGARSVLRKLKELLPRLIPKVVLKDDRTDVEWEFEFDVRGEKIPLIEDLFEAVAKIGARQGKRAVVVFDEFQEIIKWDAGNQIERQMRSHFQMHGEVSYIFMGSKRHLMQDLFQNKNRPFYRFGKHFPLGKIPEGDLSEFIRTRFDRTGFRIEPGTIEEILKVTEHHPYYTQLFCSVIWEAKRSEQVISESDIRQGVHEVLTRESHAFHDLWDVLPFKARQLLVAFAREAGESKQIYSDIFLKKYNLGSASSVQRALERIQREEILEKINGEYKFGDVFFKRWILVNFL